MTNPPPAPDPSDKPNVLVLPPLLYVAALAAGLLVHWVAPHLILTSSTHYWAGGILVALGVAIAVWGRVLMARAGTNVNPFQPTTAIVTTGPFRFSRNPLYVGLTLTYLGGALLTNSLWVLALLAPVLLIMHFGVVRREERYLEMKFGDAYRAYRARVRRYV